MTDDKRFPPTCKALTHFIRQEIDRHQGSLSFAAFMEAALYHPELGYYNAHSLQIGAQGDFTTAPEISPLFGQSLARQVRQIAQTLQVYDILELGAGSGRLAGDLLTALSEANALPERYYILEISHHLRKQQQAFFKEKYPALFTRMIWLEQLPTDFCGVIIANEVLDALPVHRLYIDNNTIKELQVTWQDNAFAFTLTHPSASLFEQADLIRQSCALENDYLFEINLRMQTLVASLAENLAKGVILFLDYGYGQKEYYHPERRRGTLTCFYQHTKHDNPLLSPGLQDITAHVDFTRVAEVATEHGCTLAGFTSQAAFLLACGMLDLAAEEEKKLSVTQQFQLHHAIKLLTLPTEMGERIKVMALGKHFHDQLIGFSLQDRRRDL